MAAYTAPKSYNSSFIAAISGNFLKTLSSKSFFILFFHVSIGCFTISFKETAGRTGFISANASRVDTKISGLIKIIWYPFNDNSTGSNRFPIPVAKTGLFRMKKAQSAPSFTAYSSIRSVLSPNENLSFRSFIIQAASDDPPPSPAPAGICLYMCISTGNSPG